MIVVAEFQIRVGPFQPSLRNTGGGLGGAFRFVARDVDGLPVVGDTFNGAQRASSFRAELHVLDVEADLSAGALMEQLRARAELTTTAITVAGEATAPETGEAAATPLGAASEMKELLIQYVGNKELSKLSGTWSQVVTPPFEQDGTMEVEIALDRTGPHVITLYGPNGGSRTEDQLPTERLPWTVLAHGVCPIGQGEIQDRKCGCLRGYEQPPDCTACAPGSMKHLPGGDTVCLPCAQTIFPGVGYDPLRSETSGPAASRFEVSGLNLHIASSHLLMRVSPILCTGLRMHYGIVPAARGG